MFRSFFYMFEYFLWYIPVQRYDLVWFDFYFIVFGRIFICHLSLLVFDDYLFIFWDYLNHFLRLCHTIRLRILIIKFINISLISFIMSFMILRWVAIVLFAPTCGSSFFVLEHFNLWICLKSPLALWRICIFFDKCFVSCVSFNLGRL